MDHRKIMTAAKLGQWVRQGTVLLCVVLGAAHAEAAGPENCQANGGPLECEKADIWFTSQVSSDPTMYQSGTAACAAIANHATLRSPLYWANHPQYGTGCEYDVYSNDVYEGRFFYQNWVIPTQNCRELPNPAVSWGDWLDTADQAESANGRRWCQYDLPQAERSCKVGKPVQPGTGREAHSQADYLGSSASAQELIRSYRSVWLDGLSNGLAPIGEFQGGWMLSVQTSVSSELPRRLKPTRRVSRPDGEVTTFYGSPPVSGPRTWTTTDGTRDQLIEVRDSAGNLTGWQYKTFTDDSVETYDALGHLTKIVQRNGWVTTLNYSTANTPVASYRTGGTLAQAGLLVSVRNHFGREIKFVYDAQARVSQVLPPAAVKDSAAGSATSPIRYSYEEAAYLGSTPPMGQLTSVTWQDGSVRRYHYEDARFPNALTGITDELGVRVETRSYDAVGRVAEEAAVSGVDRLQFSYNNGSLGQSNQTTVTDYSGVNGGATSRTYTFQNLGGTVRPTTITAPCPLCGNTQASTTYDAAGNITKTIAHDGSVTFYAYDSKGRETERAVFPGTYQSATTRPALSAAISVTSTQWHATWKLPTQVAEPGKLTSYTYDSKGNLTGQSWSATTDGTGQAKFSAVKTGSTYATGWGYDANSLATSIVEKTDATETGRWTLAYNSLGDVTSVKDVKRNLTATLTSYDASGRMLAGKTDAAVPINFTYAPRGFVKTKVVNGQTITFVQNAIGLTTEVRTPDNQTLNYVYDATHRLTNIKLNGASITPAMLASADYPDTYAKGKVEQFKVLAREAIEALMAPAFAQTAGALGRAIVVLPGQPMPGQPEFDPRADMMTMAPMSNMDKAARRIAEKFAEACECRPEGGYEKPTFTLKTFAHLLFGGHLSARFTSKSYFATTEKVGQHLVDEVLAKKLRERTEGKRQVIVANMGRSVGYERVGSTFVVTNYVTLVYEISECKTNFRARNEVVTLYPGGGL